MTYREKVMETIRDKSTSLTLGLVAILFAMSTVLILTNQKKISVTEIDKQNREAFLQQQQITPRIYVVQEGDGLWQIAEKVYGDGYAWPKIAQANNIDVNNPSGVTAGQKLVIPDVPSKTPEPSPSPFVEQGQIDGGMTGKAAPLDSEYIVQEGEGLWQIAEKVYGDGNAWVEIARANNLTNPEGVSPGMKLIMPSLK